MTLTKLQLTGIVLLTAVVSVTGSIYVYRRLSDQVIGVLALNYMVNDLQVVSASVSMLRDDRRDRVPTLLCMYINEITPLVKAADESVREGILPLWAYRTSRLAPNLERIEKLRPKTIDAKIENCQSAVPPS